MRAGTPGQRLRTQLAKQLPERGGDHRSRVAQNAGDRARQERREQREARRPGIASGYARDGRSEATRIVWPGDGTGVQSNPFTAGELTMPKTTRALLHGSGAILLAVTLGGGVAFAQATDPLAPSPPAALAARTPAVAPSSLEAPPPAAPRTRSHHVLGLSLDAGLPDGASATVLYRPLKYLRFGGGLLYNYVGYGVMGSVSVLPYFPVAPSLTLEAGHYFEANASSRISQFTTLDDNLKPLLQRVGYTFVNAHVGLEFGHPNWFVFFVRGGLSRVWLSSSNADKVLVTTSEGTRVTFADPSARLGIPTVKAGFMIFFY
jgi:hypothetical protein